jgi:hypothetical protein
MRELMLPIALLGGAFLFAWFMVWINARGMLGAHITPWQVLKAPFEKDRP